jgi:hypothetical protein
MIYRSRVWFFFFDFFQNDCVIEDHKILNYTNQFDMWFFRWSVIGELSSRTILYCPRLINSIFFIGIFIKLNSLIAHKYTYLYVYAHFIQT